MPAENPTVPIPRYTPTHTEQVQFEGGVNALTVPHLLRPNEVAASTNVDHTLEWGGGAARRGSQLFGLVSGIANVQVTAIARLYGTGDASPWFAVGTSGGTNVSLEGTLNAGTVTLSSLAAPSVTTQTPAYITEYGSYAYVVYGTSAVRSNGTNTFDWLMPQPSAPTNVVQLPALSTPFVEFNGTLTATVSGAVSATGAGTGGYASYSLTTGNTGTGTCLIMWGTTSSVTDWTGTRTTTIAAPPVTYAINGTSTQTSTIGNYGVDYAAFAIDNPNNLILVSLDVSVGDITFTNYWHSETTIGALANTTPDPAALFLAAQLNKQLTSLMANAVGVQSPISPRRKSPLDPVGGSPRSGAAIRTNAAPTYVYTWPIPRTDWQFVGNLGNPGWSSIQAVRYTFYTYSADSLIVAGPILNFGNSVACLTDTINGLLYYQTFARVENGLIVAESNPSPASAPIFVQGGVVDLKMPGTTNTSAGITHQVLYRQGGLLQDAYQIGMVPISTSSQEVRDSQVPDLTALLNPIMQRNLLAAPWPSNVTAVSEPYQERIFIAEGNALFWSAPGTPTRIQSDTDIVVSNTGDTVQGFSVWDRLLVVNQNSVYEMYGTIFEGPNQNWTLSRTGARRGSAAPKTIIKTPYGVLLFGFDGASVYYPGYGVDTQLTWVNERIGDLWRGTLATDPAGLKGNRIPALNASAIAAACAAYGDNRIYLAVPTGTNTLCDTVFVLDMARQIVSGVYQYPFQISSLFWDYINNRLIAGVLGGLQHLELGLSDSGTAVTWNFTTRDWTTPTDVILENLQAEGKGQGVSMSVQVDNNATQSLGTLTNAAKDWTPLSFGGTIGRRMSFTAKGTQSSSQQEVTQLQWDFIPQTPRVTFFETDVIPMPSENYIKTWLPLIDTFGTATVTATLLVDGVAVTLASGSNTVKLIHTIAGKKWDEVSMANITVGKTVQAVYSSSQPFKYYQTEFEFEPKPFDKTTWLITYKKAGGVTQADMARFYAMDIEGTALATYTSTWIIDGTAFSTNTLVFGASDAGEEVSIVRNYMDQIPFPPGGRGYLFQQQITSANAFKVWRASLDIERIGIKGLSRSTINGTPSETGRGQ